MVWVLSRRTNGRVAGPAVDSLVSLVQARRLQEEVGEQSSTIDPDSRLDEMREWTMPLEFGLDNRPSSGKTG